MEGINAYVNNYAYKYTYICICVFLRLLCLSIVLCMRSLLLVESFDLHPNNQYILVRRFLVVSILRKCVCAR
jgi:hypothetical protein